jgi:hypothetical protein
MWMGAGPSIRLLSGRLLQGTAGSGVAGIGFTCHFSSRVQ